MLTTDRKIDTEQIRATALVLGRGGLLGQSVIRILTECNQEEWQPEDKFPYPWHDPEAFESVINKTVKAFLSHAADLQRPWQIYWCAGRGSFATDPAYFEHETTILSLTLQAINNAIKKYNVKKGVLFYSSSAGGAYLGNKESLINESVVPIAINQYGKHKLLQEEILNEFSQETGLNVFIGRFSNLYGPAQRLDKRQGIITQLLLSSLTQKPCEIFVPLQISRDYLYVDDAAKKIVWGVSKMSASAHSTQNVTKIIASGQNTSLSQLVHLARDISKRPIKFTTSDTGNSMRPSMNLSFRSIIESDLDRIDTVTIIEGMLRVYQSLTSLISSGSRNK